MTDTHFKKLQKKYANEAPTLAKKDLRIKSSIVSLATVDNKMDNFECIISEYNNPKASFTIQYSQGLGYRQYKYYIGLGKSDFDYLMERSHRLYPEGLEKLNQCSKAKLPSITDVLYYAVLDMETHLELREEIEPLDYIALEYGYKKPSDCIRIEKTLRENYLKLNDFLLALNVPFKELKTVFQDY